MGETVQKLTVKMPWSQKLKHAEVSEVHARSGRFVTSDDAVLTLVTDSGRHKVRASQAGRIVMLVSSGDRVGEGDPLYVLRLEEPAGAKSPGPASESAPRLGAWRGDAPAARVGRWFGDWAWFLLAIGIYGVAARLLIPRLPVWLPDETALGWLLIASGLSLVGFLVVVVLAKRGGTTARRFTWGLAACWAVLSFGGISHQTGGFSPALDELRALTQRGAEGGRADSAGTRRSDTPPASARPSEPPETAAAPGAGAPSAPGREAEDTAETAGAAPGTGVRVGTDLTTPAPVQPPGEGLAPVAAEAPLQARLPLPDATWRVGDVLGGAGSLALSDAAPATPAGPSGTDMLREMAARGPDTPPPGAIGDVALPDWSRYLRRAPSLGPAVVEPGVAAGLSAQGRAPRATTQTAGLGPVAPANPLPFISPRFARISLLFQYIEDPREPNPPTLGDPYSADLPPDVALAVQSQTVNSMRAVVQVTGWCIAAGDRSGIKRISTDAALYRRVALSDRLRLILVDLVIEADTIGMLSDALPVFGGAEPGFFHNRRPMMGGFSGPQLLTRGQDWLGAQSSRQIDPNFPEITSGGSFYFGLDDVVDALGTHGCAVPVWQGGAPTTALGRAVDQALAQ